MSAIDPFETSAANPGVTTSHDAIAAGVSATTAAVAAYQAAAGRFITEYGAGVTGGHTPVGLAQADNVGADPETSGPDADESA